MNKKEVKQFLERLHNIAKELNKPLDAPDVIVAYDKKYGGYSIELSDTIVRPIYFPKERTKEISPL